ncbi:MAG: hypothetical protein QT03_C0001G0263 [archaeon GW2011_AR10]|uniref:Addiction module toxin, HicA family n=1 Tax=Candidatus Iainarchaeum sp. TaxID=3101447 RepID=A0A7J4ISN9_9ARCH|nr:MAG: hypothetical protein QT03_C0001G0263 [archaeon GW2011_AR10]HIH08533.1 addiction module toxin, HicA family [Candidatus Diapherotrites archaeon]
MGFLPSLKPYRVLKVLKKAGFFVHHQTGSHVVLKHIADKSKRVIVPVHKKDLKIRTIRSIISEAGFTVEGFKKLL